MDGIERAIRNALDKGDATDGTFRERVYRQAFAALDKAIKQNPELTVEAAIKRRQALQARITEVELGFVRAARVPPEERSAAMPELGGVTRDAAADAPRVEIDTRVDAADAPSGDMPSPEPPVESRETATDAAPALGGEIRMVTRSRRRGLAAVFVGVTLAAAVAIGLWWAADSGFFLSEAERDTSVPNPPVTLEEESFDPPSSSPPPLADEAGAERDWITVFETSDAAGVSASGGSSAELVQDEDERFMRIQSASAEDAVLFDVGQGVLEQVAGRKAVFVITARAEEGSATQISVECDFGALGDCGRKRYAVGYEQGEFLFEVELPEQRPGAAGTIAITSDVEGKGRAVDIYDIRVAISE